MYESEHARGRGKALSEEEIEAYGQKASGWERRGDHLVRQLQFGSFLEAVGFIRRIAQHADELDHHPEIRNVYDQVSLELTTHDAGGLTSLDFELAERINGELQGS